MKWELEFESVIVVEKSNNRTHSKTTHIANGAFESVTGITLENFYRLLLLLYNMYVSCQRHFFTVLLLNQR